MREKILIEEITRPLLTTSLPSNPSDGDEIILTDSLTAGTYHWHFRYVSARSSNKWIFVGGAPGFAQVLTAETTNSASYAALSTAGPTFTLPAAGDYNVEIGFINTTVTTARANTVMSYDIGATGAVDGDSVRCQGVESNATYNSNVSRAMHKAGLTAVALTAKYKTSAGELQSFANRWMRVTPVAIGG